MILAVCFGLRTLPLGWSNKIIAGIMQSTVVTPSVRPSAGQETGEEHDDLFHVVLLDDDEHTYDYVIEMLQKLFFLSLDAAFQHAVEVDTTGRTIVITCERPQAEFARDQIQSYGADPRMPKSKGSMSAVLIPAGKTATI